jgi:ubiquinone/menaquinone biosynthesis C-methylase UbiE
MNPLATTFKRRFTRMRRRQKVGRAYDMALEIARVLKPGAAVLDVGCGTGFIAHHLSALLRTPVVGLDVANHSSTSINYQRFDGRHFPVADQSFDAVLLCYVLHHAQDARLLLDEVRRVLRDGGVSIIYEDNPACWWDKAICWTHNLQWQGRTGRCTFQLEDGWQRMFALAGFKVVKQRRLSRWRNIAHPVSRNFFVLSPDSNLSASTPTVQPELLTGHAREIPARA